MVVHGCANFVAIGCTHALEETPQVRCLVLSLECQLSTANSKILPKHAITKGLDRRERIGQCVLVVLGVKSESMFEH